MDQRILAQLNLADKGHNLAEHWRARAQYWDNQIKQCHDARLFCHEQCLKISEIRRRLYGKDSLRKSTENS